MEATQITPLTELREIMPLAESSSPGYEYTLRRV